MRILIANDDGIDSAGLKALADALSAAKHSVTVIAPDSQRSACSHGIISHRGITYNAVDLSPNYKAYSCNGTPADCVKLGVLLIMKNNLPDLVISGINYGTNLGSDVIFSGTVAAACEGAYQGIKSVAISTERAGYAEHIGEVCAYILEMLPLLTSLETSRGKVININYPTSVAFKGTYAVKAGIYSYADDYKTEGLDSFTVDIMEKCVESEKHDKEIDVEYFRKGYATVSVLDIDMNDYDSTNKLKELLK